MGEQCADVEMGSEGDPRAGESLRRKQQWDTHWGSGCQGAVEAPDLVGSMMGNQWGTNLVINWASVGGVSMGHRGASVGCQAGIKVTLVGYQCAVNWVSMGHEWDASGT